MIVNCTALSEPQIQYVLTFLNVISIGFGVSKTSRLRHICDGAISCLCICNHMTVNKQINKHLVFSAFVHRSASSITFNTVSVLTHLSPP